MEYVREVKCMARYRVIVRGVPKRWEDLGNKSVAYMQYLMDSLCEQFGNDWQLEFDFGGDAYDNLGV